jgi:hypothetical protein
VGSADVGSADVGSGDGLDGELVTGSGVQVGDGDAEAWFAAGGAPVPTSGTEAGIGVSSPVGSSEVPGGMYVKDGGVVLVGGPDVVAGQVLASSRYWTCAWPFSVITMAAAPTSCAPGSVAT